MKEKYPRHVGHVRRGGESGFVVRALLSVAVAIGAGSPARAEEGKWSFEFAPMYMQVYGHDQHVLNTHELDLTATPVVDDTTAVSLDVKDDFAYSLRFRYTGGQWGWGVDYFLLLTSQKADDLLAAADGPAGPIEEVIFEVADRSYTSTDPGEVLFYEVLEDTDLEVWTFDIYGLRTLAEKPESAIGLQLGLRLGDFDNDYHAVVGIQNVSGSRTDASSNYPLMMGPLVGLMGHVRHGRNTLEGSIGQSILIGTAELDSMIRDFTGAYGPTPAYVARETFTKDQDVAIPITDLRLRWTCRVGDHVSLGAGLNTSVWWDVSVPPGVVPVENGDETLHENTVIFFGLSGTVSFVF